MFVADGVAAFIVIVGIVEKDDDGVVRVRMRKLKIFCIQNDIMNSAAWPVHLVICVVALFAFRYKGKARTRTNP